MKTTLSLVIGFSVMINVMSTDVAGQQNSAAPQPLIVGTKEAPPFSMKTSDGQWTGLSIDLWRQIAAELNLQFEFRELSLNQLLEGVSDGSLDAVVAALTITSEREKKFDFTHGSHCITVFTWHAARVPPLLTFKIGFAECAWYTTLPCCSRSSSMSYRSDGVKFADPPHPEKFPEGEKSYLTCARSSRTVTCNSSWGPLRPSDFA